MYPLAQVKVQIDGNEIEVEVVVSDTLPMSVLLGTDVPELSLLPKGELEEDKQEIRDSETACMVLTRAASRKKQTTEQMLKKMQVQSGVKPKDLVNFGTPQSKVEPDSDVKEKSGSDDTLHDWIHSVDDKLFSRTHNKKRLTRSKKRKDRRKHHLVQDTSNIPPPHILDMSSKDFKELQQQDPTLSAVREAAKGCPSTPGVGFFIRDGVLFRRWIPPGRSDEAMEVEQLVLPSKCRQEVLHTAHTIPLAGHLGREKTARPVLQRFYWPTLYRDVAKYCQSCSDCQKSSPRGVKRAPLVSLPIIATPFKRIATDIIGPLPRSKSRKRYILVVCDYETRYPEAIPLKSIDASEIPVAEELIKLFSHVGIPDEILTDQGSNFTSQLLIEIYRMLHIHPIRTTPYHPQTNGLAERFNKLSKTCSERQLLPKERTGTG